MPERLPAHSSVLTSCQTVGSTTFGARGATKFVCNQPPLPNFWFAISFADSFDDPKIAATL
jgi:hypothetical protein